MKYVLLTLTLCVTIASAQTQTTPKASAKAKSPAKAANAPNLLQPSTLRAPAPAVYVVQLETTKGTIEIRVTKAWAPIGADRFYNLVRAGFYTDASFFRVIKGFMAQVGLSARPEVTRAWEKTDLKDDPVLQSNKRGFVSFATSGPNTRSTQIFIGMRDNGYLDASGFAPFGEVIEGMDVVDMLYSGYGNVDAMHPRLENQGKAFLDANYPKLDRILKATIEPPAAPAAK